MVSHRSTKGASKARRDHINREIKNMCALLPVHPEEERERLSYLHSMAAICTYIRKSVLLQGLPADDGSDLSLPFEDFFPALRGFILATTAQGKLVYVSENVTEFLGLSMVDVLQGDTLFDMVERCDFDVVKSNLDVQNNSAPERSFVCRMHSSRAFKLQHSSCCSMLVKGRFQSFSSPCSPLSSSAYPADQPLFVALCTPTVDRLPSSEHSFSCHSFDSIHALDMTFTELSESVSYFLGYSAEEMAGRSWYGLVHPEDLSSSADSHRSLMQADEGLRVEVVLRLQGKDLSWTWLYTQATKECQSICCTNVIISETEANFLRDKICSRAFRQSTAAEFTAQQQQPDVQGHGGTRCQKRRRRSSSDSQSEGPSAARARRDSEQQDVLYHAQYASSQSDISSAPSSCGDSPLFTPPYSPAASSGSPPRWLHRDPFGSGPDLLLMDARDYTDHQPLLSSPESSPSSYYSYYPEAGLACPQSPPDSLDMLPEQAFDRAFISSPTFDFQASTCAPDARLVPEEGLPVSDVYEGLAVDRALHQDDHADFFGGLPEGPQGGAQFVPTRPQIHPGLLLLLTPDQSPASSSSTVESTVRYDEREQEEISILAQQISSLASSFSAMRQSGLEPVYGEVQTAAEIEDGVFDSILKDLDVIVGGSGKACGLGVQVEAYSSYHQPSCRRSLEQLEQEPMGPSPNIPDQFTAMDPFGMQLGGRHNLNVGLHQLNHYMQSGLQQDGLAEEHLY